MITGLIRPDSGQVLIHGKLLGSDTDPIKGRIGLVPQDLALYEDLDARRNLEFFAAIQGVHRAKIPEAVESALRFVGLLDRANDRVTAYSGGMKRRLNLAAALLHDPEILLLDEPTVGVDPQSRNAIFENVAAFRARGKTLLYTSHYMEEVERLCDRVIIVDHGKIIADDTLSRLRHQHAGDAELRLQLGSIPDVATLERIRSLSGIRSVALDGRVIRIGLPSISNGCGDVLTQLEALALEIRSFSAEPPDLESIFLRLTGRSLRDS
jgi:ABC-2 type transport system ATP-binding protein